VYPLRSQLFGLLVLEVEPLGRLVVALRPGNRVVENVDEMLRFVDPTLMVVWRVVALASFVVDGVGEELSELFEGVVEVFVVDVDDVFTLGEVLVATAVTGEVPLCVVEVFVVDVLLLAFVVVLAAAEDVTARVVVPLGAKPPPTIGAFVVLLVEALAVEEVKIVDVEVLVEEVVIGVVVEKVVVEEVVVVQFICALQTSLALVIGKSHRMSASVSHAK
jgi:hypothetical protein